jgi:hypothetical protein
MSDAMSDYTAPEVAQVKAFNLIGEELKFHKELKVGSRQGNASVNVINYPPSQGSGPFNVGSQLSWQIPFPVGTYVDSCPELYFEHTVTYNCVTDADFAGTLANAFTAMAGNIGFNSFPNNRLIQTANVRINGQVQMSSNPTDDVNAYLYQFGAEKLKDLSTLCTPDTMYYYDNSQILNPLKSQSDSYGWSRGLGSTKIKSVTYTANASKANSSLVIVYEHAEKLLCRPFQYLEKAQTCFVGITDLSITMNIVSDSIVNRASANNATKATIASHTIANCGLRFKQYQPNANLSQPIPNRAYWNTPLVERTDADSKDALNPANTGTVGAVPTISIQTNSRAFSTMPKLYAVYAYVARTSSTPERLLPIRKLTVDNGIKQNLLYNYTAQDLFRLSVKNGYNANAQAFFGGYLNGAGGVGSGCVVYFTPSDIDCELYQQSNVTFNHVFRITAEIANPSAETYASGAVKLRLVTFTDALIKYEDKMFSEDLASITPQELASATDMFVNMRAENAIMGGGFFDFLKPITRWLRNNTGVISSVARKMPIPAFVADAIDDVGNIVKDGTNIGNAAQRNGWGKPKKGGSILNLAGAKMTKKEMLAMLSA